MFSQSNPPPPSIKSKSNPTKQTHLLATKHSNKEQNTQRKIIWFLGLEQIWVFGFGADPTELFLPPQIQRSRFTPPTLTPPKWCRQTPLFLPSQPLRQTTLSWQTTTLLSLSSSSIKERVWPRCIVLSHASQVRFSGKIHCSHCFLCIKREAWSVCHWSACELRCVVEKKTEWASVMDLQWRVRDSIHGWWKEGENLRLIFDEIISKREFDLFGYLVEDHRG